MMNAKQLHERRKLRNRYQLKKKSTGRPRLSIHRTGQNMYAQVIDDTKGVTLASASTLEVDMRKTLKTGADKAAAAAIGTLVAKRAIEAGCKEVVFDRGGFVFHGRVKELADAAREAGLQF